MRTTILIIYALLSGCGLAEAQTVKHHSFTVHYNAKIKESDSVSWDLTPAMVGCPDESRKDAFAQDKAIPGSAKPSDYAVNSSIKTSPKYNADRASWIDEGHIASYQDMMCNGIDKVECFLMTNMLPQFHAFNAGDWKSLEVQERVWAKTTTLHIIGGGLGVCTISKKFPKGHLPSGEVIPAYMWKAIYMNRKWTCWIMPNAGTSVGHKYDFWEVPVKDFDAKTGLKL